MNIKRKLLTVEDTFFIAGRGLIVVPGIPFEQFSKPTELEVELKKPDGSVKQGILSLLIEFGVPPPKIFQYACIFRGLQKEEVPIGTEIWYVVENVA
jgi:hypothetical protein